MGKTHEDQPGGLGRVYATHVVYANGDNVKENYDDDGSNIT